MDRRTDSGWDSLHGIAVYGADVANFLKNVGGDAVFFQYFLRSLSAGLAETGKGDKLIYKIDRIQILFAILYIWYMGKRAMLYRI